MNSTDLCYLSATEMADLIHNHRLSPVDLVDALLARIEAVNPSLNAYLTVDDEGARAAARRAEKAGMRGERLGLLHGLPVSIKDLEPTAGLRCTYGSRFYADHVAADDGPVSERVKAAGGIVLGKTNTPQWGHKDTCDNLLGPPGRNPWALDRTPGGSSGGAAAAVAAGLGPLAHGSDGAGSIRIPAALCGVFGFKPSFGRVPYWPNPDIWACRSHNGPLTRTVADAALMLAVIAGPDPRDPTTIDNRPADYLAALTRAPQAVHGLRVAWSEDFGYALVDPEVRQITRQAVLLFEQLGCRVEPQNPSWEDPREKAELAWQVSFAARLGAQYDQRPDWFEPSLAHMIETGRRATGPQVIEASMARTELYGRALAFFRRYDLLVTPQMPLAAWSVDREPAEIEGTPVHSMFDRLPFTVPFNLTGQPAASVPCGQTRDGLPVALQIVGPWHRDTLVLQAAAAFEEAQPWAHLRPAP